MVFFFLFLFFNFFLLIFEILCQGLISGDSFFRFNHYFNKYFKMKSVLVTEIPSPRPPSVLNGSGQDALPAL